MLKIQLIAKQDMNSSILLEILLLISVATKQILKLLVNLMTLRKQILDHNTAENQLNPSIILLKNQFK